MRLTPSLHTLARCFAHPLAGGIASGRAKPFRGDRWDGLLRGRLALGVSAAFGLLGLHALRQVVFERVTTIG